jgi:hypothetical protein
VRGGRKDAAPGVRVCSGSHAPHASPLAPTYASAGNTRRLPVPDEGSKSSVRAHRVQPGVAARSGRAWGGGGRKRGPTPANVSTRLGPTAAHHPATRASPPEPRGRPPHKSPTTAPAGKAGIANAPHVLLKPSDSTVRFASCLALGYSYSSCPVRGRARVSSRRSLAAKSGAASGHARRPTSL